MNSSLIHLPLEARRELKIVTRLICQEIPECEMIILYGAYAHKNYLDRRDIDGNLYLDSEYNLLIVTSLLSDLNILDRLKAVENKYLTEFLQDPQRKEPIPILFSHENIDVMNQRIADGRFFNTNVKREGILLYSTNRLNLVRHRRKLDFQVIENQARCYAAEWSLTYESLMMGVRNNYKEKEYDRTCYLLSKACESLCQKTILTHTLRKSKQKQLRELVKVANKILEDKLYPLFLQRGIEERLLFGYLEKAYAATYETVVISISQSDLDRLIKKVELFHDIADHSCESKLRWFHEQIQL